MSLSIGWPIIEQKENIEVTPGVASSDHHQLPLNPT